MKKHRIKLKRPFLSAPPSPAPASPGEPASACLQLYKLHLEDQGPDANPRGSRQSPQLAHSQLGPRCQVSAKNMKSSGLNHPPAAGQRKEAPAFGPYQQGGGLTGFFVGEGAWVWKVGSVSTPK